MADRARTKPSAPSKPRPVRRNLFQPDLTRRPTASSSNSVEAVRLDADSPDTSEIVVRDQHGEIEIGDPPTPVLEEPDDALLDERAEVQKERQRLADAVKSHQINNSAIRDQPEELLEAVRASLRAKVAALAEDSWIFGAEEQRQ